MVDDATTVVSESEFKMLLSWQFAIIFATHLGKHG
jgi:hypothetical protein